MKPSKLRAISSNLLGTLGLVLLFTSIVAAPGAAQKPAPRPEAATVLGDLQSPEPEERVAAARQLSLVAIDLWTRDFDEVASLMLTALHDSELEVRQAAAVSFFQATWVIWGTVEMTEEQQAVIAEASPKLRRLHAQLLAALDDPDPIVREYLLRALGTWMPEVPAGISDAVVRLVDDPSTKVAQLALRVMGRAGERSNEVVSTILQTLEERAELRATAAAVLAELFGEHTRSAGRAAAPPEIIEALNRAAGDSDENVRVAALQALGRVGGGSESARARLRAAADNRQQSQRERLKAEESLDLLNAHEGSSLRRDHAGGG